MEGSTGHGAGWQPPQPPPPPGPPGPQGPVEKAGYPPVVLAGFGVIAVLVLAIVVTLVVTGDDGSDGGDPGDEAAASTDTSTTTTAPEDTPETDSESDPGGSVFGGGDYVLPEREDVTSGTASDAADLPAPDIPAEADPPDYDEEAMSDLEWLIDPFSDLSAPTVGAVRVTGEPGGYVDIPVHLETGEMFVRSIVDEGIAADVTMFDPAGESIGTWSTDPNPDVITGWEFDEPVAEPGTYVFRVVQNSDGEGFVLGFYSRDWEL